ncbi:MAG: NAD(P)-dependent oxidoreductase, partial [Alphaproteobacteria bacterium]|nr:NAD(P)-dependent oxidoreductase [Alphaproteobacteria bacterium]
MANITFIGLGVMGGNIARHLAAAGHSMTVYNRTAKKAQDWVSAHGGRCAASPAEAARDADAIFTCVGADDDLAAVTLGRDGAFRTMKSGALLIDHTTVSAKIARQLAVEAKDIGVLTVDAPVTGGQIGAEQGTLTLMCGGSDAGVAAATPLMQAYAKKVVHIGGPGTGQLTKMVNQITFAG